MPDLVKQLQKDPNGPASPQGLKKNGPLVLWDPPSIGTSPIARKNAKWSPPNQGWLNLNFDGASRGNPGATGIGYVIRDHKGREVDRIAMPIPPNTNNIAEFKALQLGLTDCLNHGVRNIIIEGDSAIAINAIKTKSTPNWRLQDLLDSILKNLSKLESFSARHVYREANTKADALSKVAAEGGKIYWWEDNLYPYG
ncbi:uncharacterized protein LOC131856596 [Cryptomeria japonica]|uniref:uncharacterized protein LOC131856596 n=1 Tax=Cryptomeria japonica TaxID=3369 RepID=UPI0027DA3229|nr:uncharacterized protein LOC131856596 [Cryptomeria japonica]